MPCANMQFCGPIHLDSQPINRLPSGSVPKAAIAKKLMTLPRIAGADDSCMMVLHTGTIIMVPKPHTSARISEAGKKLV